MQIFEKKLDTAVFYSYLISPNNHSQNQQKMNSEQAAIEASARIYEIYVHETADKQGLLWSYFPDADLDDWNPLTETSPDLLLKRQDRIYWYAKGDIKKLKIKHKKR